MSRLIIHSIRREPDFKEKLGSWLLSLGNKVSVLKLKYRQIQLSSLVLMCFALVSSSCAVATAEHRQYNANNVNVSVQERQAGYTSSGSMRGLIRKSPKQITAATALDIRNLFKKPHLTRQDASALVWHYASGGCAMDVYFTLLESAERQNPQVKHAEWRNREGKRLAGEEEQRCVRQLMDNPSVAELKVQNILL